MNDDDARRIVQAAFNRAHIAPSPGFETRMQVVLQAAALKQPVHRQRPRLREGLAVLAAAIAAVAVVATLLAPRIFTQVHQPAGTSSPSPTQSPVATSPTPDPNACRLPVVVDDESTHVLELTAGFIDVASGQFSSDPNISFADLPGAQVGKNGILQIAVYDSLVKRWLPSYTVSPDQQSYVYVTVKPGPAGSQPVASELHTYDLVQHIDRIVWTFAATMSTFRWSADGIYASTVPFVGGAQRYWRVDPVSTRATEINEATFNPYQSLISGPGSYGVSGPDPERALYTVGSRDPGTRYTDFVIIDGKRTDIYSGVNGDQMDFDPVNVWYDGSLLWFSNYDSKYLWSWTAANGLTRHSVLIPGAAGSDPTHPVVYSIAGPCV